MFDIDFYPTPNNVIDKMIKGLIFSSLSGNILDPSAGKGNILDYIEENKLNGCGYGYKKELCAIEKNRELQEILKGKEYILLDSDFLNYQCDTSFSLILMNPPFSNADKHFIKAFEISKGAEIRCLYPTASINNPFSKERKLVLDIIEQNNGSIEHLGQCFKEAERTTNVEVSLIIIPSNFKKYESTINFEYTNFTKENTSDSINNFKGEGLEVLDKIEATVHRYNKTIQIFKEFLIKREELLFYFKGLSNLDLDNFIKDSLKNTPNYSLKSFTKKLKKEGWKNILYATKVQNLLTYKVAKNFNNFIQSNSNLSFNSENIEKIISELFLNGSNIMKECILDSFDLMTSYYEENRVYFEGWKTNDCWKVNEKVILPRALQDNSTLWGIRLSYSMRDNIQDIEKSLCYLKGKKWTEINSIYNIFDTNSKHLNYNTWIDSEFFEFKIFKKGTIHLKFKDSELHKLFNLIACRGKNWLPPEQPKKEKNKSDNKDYSDIIPNFEETQLTLF